MWGEPQVLAKKYAEVTSHAAAPAVSQAVPPMSSASRWGTAIAVGGATVGAVTIVEAIGLG
jgi:hypothetical protein